MPESDKDVCKHCGLDVGEVQSCNGRDPAGCANMAGARTSLEASSGFIGSLDDGESFRQRIHAQYG